ncbi:MAG TPA: hypothetical protein VEG62_01345, partial [Acidimicrobiales bacterium]|nr:hypothetical protein [Acidimicrobiales bacterium]
MADGKGKVAVILPDTSVPSRYATLDGSDFSRALPAAGLSSTRYLVQSASGQDASAVVDAKCEVGHRQRNQDP